MEKSHAFLVLAAFIFLIIRDKIPQWGLLGKVVRFVLFFPIIKLAIPAAIAIFPNMEAYEIGLLILFNILYLSSIFIDIEFTLSEKGFWQKLTQHPNS